MDRFSSNRAASLRDCRRPCGGDSANTVSIGDCLVGDKTSSQFVDRFRPAHPVDHRRAAFDFGAMGYRIDAATQPAVRTIKVCIQTIAVRRRRPTGTRLAGRREREILDKGRRTNAEHEFRLVQGHCGSPFRRCSTPGSRGEGTSGGRVGVLLRRLGLDVAKGRWVRDLTESSRLRYRIA